MKPLANVAEATAGEVAAVDGSAATPAEADTASTSHPLLTSTHSHSSSVFAILFINHKTMVAIYVQKEKSFMLNIVNVYKKPIKNVGPPLVLINN
jgi:hypothetical protein